MSTSPKSFPTRRLGKGGPLVSALGFGAMGTLFFVSWGLAEECTIGIGAFYGTTDETQVYETLTKAADLGLTFWDTADVYGNSE